MGHLNGHVSERLKRLRERKWKQQDGLCWWCKEPMLLPFGCSGLSASTDHIQAIKDGGGHKSSNICLAHWSCNAARHMPVADPLSKTSLAKAAKPAREEAATAPLYRSGPR